MFCLCLFGCVYLTLLTLLYPHFTYLYTGTCSTFTPPTVLPLYLPPSLTPQSYSASMVIVLYTTNIYIHIYTTINTYMYIHAYTLNRYTRYIFLQANHPPKVQVTQTQRRGGEGGTEARGRGGGAAANPVGAGAGSQIYDYKHTSTHIIY